MSFLLLTATALLGVASAGIDDWVSPEYKYIFQFPLPIPPVLGSLASYTNTTTNKKINYFEVDIRPFEAQTYPNLGKTSYVGYNGIAPGPTIVVKKGEESVVRFINNYDRPSAIHLHGSYSRTPFDGWAEDVIPPGNYKDYYYPNNQEVRTLWYHDHAVGITAVNAYFGQAGFYILEDAATQSRVDLPTGIYDVPLMLSAKQFLPSGKLLSPENERTSLYGDVITVNSQPWPYQKVEARKYKFRLLDASVSRSFNLYLVADSAPNTKLDFTVVAGDAGYLDHPVVTKNLVLSNAERWEIVIDFEKYKNANLTLKNERDFQTNQDYPATDRIMRFVVGGNAASTASNGAIKPKLAELSLPASHPTVDRTFEFERGNGQWLINKVGFEDVKNRILAFPKRGAVERWRLVNKSGGWSHPIHIHLVDFQVVSRTGSGRKFVEQYESAALKDTVYLGRNEEVEVIANFAPWDGVYMFHCHNLVHEDHDMMAAFNVTAADLSAFGYPETTQLGDPMAQLFQFKKSTGPTDLNDIRNNVLPFFSSLNAYPDPVGIQRALDQFNAGVRPSGSSSTRANNAASTSVGAGGSTLSTVRTSATSARRTTTTSARTTSTTRAATTSARSTSTRR